ncbi:Uncharacterised protein [Mycobacterium tuberculosis]|nr:Uncharacterised protein [Mycobacterium tuberculosis]CKU85943.1 Uncharacterised protein [Mycobacterium tuberculosis]
MPVNRLAPNACAISLTARPLPQPKSATSAPDRKRSGRPSTSGSTTSIKAASNTMPLISAISLWKRGYSL